jgi:hypothetical protein
VNFADKISERILLMDSTTVRLICAGLAVLFGIVIIMRRKNRSAE